jgi:4-hydroxy 2-oxovalerate aldolase
MCVYPKFPRKMGTILSEKWADISFELGENVVFDIYEHSALQVALNLAGQANCRNILAIGFDGYDLSTGDRNEVEAFRENLNLFEKYSTIFDTQIISLTPTKYEALEKKTIFEYL